MVWSLFIGICLDFIWAYFLCVATTYATAMDGEQEPIDWTGGVGNNMPGMDMMGGDKAADAPKEEEKK